MKICMLLIVLMVSSLAQASDVRVLLVHGSVEGGPAGKLAVLKVGAHLTEGNVIKTGPDSMVLFRYEDDSRIKLKENTEVVIHASERVQLNGVDLTKGAVFASVTKQKEPHFYVKTPVAVAGVRGTQFFTSYGSAKPEAANDVWMCVQDGLVDMKPVDGRPAVAVAAGFGILVQKDKKIEAPQQYEWTKHLNWSMDPETDITDKTSLDSQYKDFLNHNYD